MLTRAGARRTCVVLATLAAGWALIVLVTGGISFTLGPLRLSSRNPRNPAIAAIALVAVAALLSPRTRRLAGIGDDLQTVAGSARTMALTAWAAWRSVATFFERRPSVAAVVVGSVAAVTVVVALTEGAMVAAGSDAYGYVSQAESWATWTLRVPQPLMRELTPELPPEALAPLAWRPSPQHDAIVPVTSPGLPMLMGLVQVVGGRDAVFAVVPLLAALAVWSAYVLGRSVAGPWVGAAAAVLLSASPSFLFQLTSSPMSDIPAMTWWTLALALALSPTSKAPLWSGVAAGLAILTRANLAPLAPFPLALVALNDGVRRRDHDAVAGPRAGARWRRMALYLAGVIPACLVIAALFTYWYGSPLDSGYGSLEQLYAEDYLAANLRRYPAWLVASQTPLIVLAFAAPIVARPRLVTVVLLAFALAVAACYLLYIPFDAWWFLRFLLPAFPVAIVLMLTVVAALLSRLPRPLGVLAGMAIVVLVARHGVGYASANAAFDADGEWKYLVTGRHVDRTVPANAVVLAEQHSGSIRYYSGRPTIRFVWIPGDRLDWVVQEVQRYGYHPYLVVEDWEQPAFFDRFGSSAVRLLAPGADSWLPLGNARVYDLAR